MKRNRLTAGIRARIPVEMKEQVDQLAQSRLLSPSDIVREALLQYIPYEFKRLKDTQQTR